MPANPSMTRADLGLPQILAAAVAIADGDGLESLSMRRVADQLGCGVMSLYRHIADKQQLIDLATDSVLGEMPLPDKPTDGWRARMHESAWRQWRLYERHPWVAATVSIGRPKPLANGMREMEWALEGLSTLAIPQAERLRIYFAVTVYVHGAAGSLAADVREERRSGLATSDWFSEHATELGEVVSSGELPNLAKLRPEDMPSTETWFEFGLRAMLDGIAASLPHDRPA